MKTNYFDLPPEYAGRDKARAVIIPVPFDLTSTWKKGADLGPKAILDASAYLELYDRETDSEPYQNGIFTCEPIAELSTPQAMIENLDQVVSAFARENKLPVVLGGEHTVTIGAVRALSRLYEDLTVVQLDAHTDLRPAYDGTPYNHACVMYQVKKICPAIQIGIRSMDAGEKVWLEPKRVFWAEDLCLKRVGIRDIVPLLTGYAYITIDLDVFDPSVMPSTGTPEPGGLTWYDVLEILRAITKHSSVVGFDVVELCPDSHHGSDFLAAKLVYKMLAYIFNNNHEI